MKISFNWLNDYLRLESSPEEISALLTDIGLEVEKLDYVESVKGGLKGVVIGEVLTKVNHPNADRLAITTVDVGDDKPLQIICGAPNVAVGQKVPVATVGTVLYEKEESLKIRKSKIRGEISQGMICGEDEIGLGDKTDGIMVLDKNAKVGMPAGEHFQLESDHIFEIGLTPNRTDAMSHIGVARELMTVLNHKGGKLKICIPSVEAFQPKKHVKNIDVVVKDYKLCPRYSALSIHGVNVSSSPDWIQKKLTAIGLVPVNNVVDITNYVLHETGQPLHAFDISKIKGSKVVVSTVKNKSKITTLDEVERELHSDDLIISNSVEPMCIAGVYGGINSGVSNETTDLFLESAYFDPVCIRKTSKRHALMTDASFRYERGCDPNLTVYALKRAALLITDLCGGEISEITDLYPNKIEHFSVKLSYANIDRIIGEVIDRKIIQSILKDLEIQIVSESDDGLSLLVPPFRADVQREIDVVEEILRIYGFNTIKASGKLNYSIASFDKIDGEEIRNIVSDLLSNTGFQEVINNSLTKSNYTDFIFDLNIDERVELLNPLSRDLSVMRQSLLFSGLENIAYNHNRKNSNIKLYEFGKIYNKTKNGYYENSRLQLLTSGRLFSENWNSDSKNVDFFFIKQKVEHILTRLGIKNISSEQINSNGYEVAIIYKFNKSKLVTFGKLDQNLCRKFDIKSEVYAADFDLDLLIKNSRFNCVKYRQVSKFPEVRRDLSLLLDKSISFDSLKTIALKVDNKILNSVTLFDVYEGNKIPAHKKSYALSFVMSDKTKTLTDKYVDGVMSKLVTAFKDNLGAELRDS